MIGLSENSINQEMIVDKDDSTKIRYKIVGEEINLTALKAELEKLENKMKEPDNEELINLGRLYHPYYTQIDNSERIAEIKEILGE